MSDSLDSSEAAQSSEGHYQQPPNSEPSAPAHAPDDGNNPEGSVDSQESASPEGSENQENENENFVDNLYDDDDDESPDEDFVDGGASARPPSLLASFYNSFAKHPKPESQKKRPRGEDPAPVSSRAPRPAIRPVSSVMPPASEQLSPESKNHRRKRLRYQPYGGLEQADEASSSSSLANHSTALAVGEVLVKRPLGG